MAIVPCSRAQRNDCVGLLSVPKKFAGISVNCSGEFAGGGWKIVEKPVDLATLRDRKMTNGTPLKSGNITMDCTDPETGEKTTREVDWDHYRGPLPVIIGDKMISDGDVIVCRSNGQQLDIPVDAALEKIIYPSDSRKKPSYGKDFEEALKDRIRANKHKAY